MYFFSARERRIKEREMSNMARGSSVERVILILLLKKYLLRLSLMTGTVPGLGGLSLNRSKFPTYHGACPLCHVTFLSLF
jgi:hypothetical protein